MVLDSSSFPGESSKIVPASNDDYEQIADFLNNNIHIHRHLDWFSSLEWVGRQPFLLEIAQNAIEAMLCAVPDNKWVAWLRIFGVCNHRYALSSWDLLLSETTSQLKSKNINCLATLVLHPWFKNLILSSQFEHVQDVIVLEWKGNFPKLRNQNKQVQIRQMQLDDLNQVIEIDHQAFTPLWQNTIKEFQKACCLSGIMTVASINGQLVGYQISTISAIGGHLARLAVLPHYQRMGIAFTLIYDLLENLIKQKCSKVTVNTQSDNKPSLALYQKFGFRQTAEKIPVFKLNL